MLVSLRILCVNVASKKVMRKPWLWGLAHIIKKMCENVCAYREIRVRMKLKIECSLVVKVCKHFQDHQKSQTHRFFEGSSCYLSYAQLFCFAHAFTHIKRLFFFAQCCCHFCINSRALRSEKIVIKISQLKSNMDFKIAFFTLPLEIK